MKTMTCLHLTPSHAARIELKRRSGRWEQGLISALPLSDKKQAPINHPEIVGVIGKLLQKTQSKKIVVSISSDAVLVKSIQLPQPLPDVDDSLKRQAIETTLETENHIPLPLDKAAYDYHLSSPQSLLLGWTRLDGLAQIYQSLRAISVEWINLTPKPVLLANSLIRQSDPTERVCGVLVQEGWCDLAVVEAGEILGARSFEVQLPDGLWEAVKKTVDNCPNPNGSPLKRLVRFQDNSSTIEVPAGVFDCEVTTATFDWAEVLIKSIERDDSVELNLLKPLLLKQRMKRKIVIKQWIFRLLPIALAMLLIGANFYLWQAIESTQSRIDPLQDRYAQVKQLHKKTEALKADHNQIEKALTQLTWVERKYPKLAKRLRRIAQSIQKNTNLQLTEIHTLPPPRKTTHDFDTRKTLRLIGLAKAQNDIDAFRLALVTHPDFASVQQIKTEQTLIKGQRRLEFTLLLTSAERKEHDD
ncbi:MAG: hypothetical protein F4Z01_06980 [Gammaproteobacteria bacterium]|nr:hypothetical protein [Gammaproteobacteria bacterium]